jgi:hypothetical protein
MDVGAGAPQEERQARTCAAIRRGLTLRARQLQLQLDQLLCTQIRSLVAQIRSLFAQIRSLCAQLRLLCAPLRCNRLVARRLGSLHLRLRGSDLLADVVQCGLQERKTRIHGLTRRHSPASAALWRVNQARGRPAAAAAHCAVLAFPSTPGAPPRAR